MATATLCSETAIQFPASTAWWRRRDPYVLAPVAAVQVIAFGPALHWIGNASDWQCLQALLTGVISAQVFLLGTWAAFGGLKTLPRLGLISLVFLCGLSSYLVAARMNLLDSLDSLLEGGLIGALVLSFYSAMLLPLRRLFGWRVDFDASHYRHLRGRRGQLGLLDLAALSCAIAFPLTTMRLIVQYSANSTASQWLSFLGLFIIVAVTAAPASYFAMAWRRPLPILAAAAVVALPVSQAHSQMSLWIKELVVVGNLTTTWGINLDYLMFHAGVATTCLATFAVLRWFGLKLLVVPLPESTPQGPHQTSIMRSVIPTMSPKAA